MGSCDEALAFRSAGDRPEVIRVAVAVLVDEQGRSLLMQRLPGTHMAGCWEFPGGKLEPGEAVGAALDRELREELGIRALHARPLIRIRHDYPGRPVLLDCWRVDAWEGSPEAKEGHRLAWSAPGALLDHDLLAADRPIVSALNLPGRYAITADTDPATLLDGIGRLLDAGHTLIQYRASDLAAFADALALCRARGARLLLNSDPETMARLDADGVHLTAARLMAMNARPVPAGRLVAASCHDKLELAHAARIACDFAVLGPVNATRSHPGAEPMGWHGFSTTADCAGLPVYAVGGVGDRDLDTAHTCHGQGVAGISAWW